MKNTTTKKAATKKATLLTHLSYDSSANSFISNALPISSTKLPAGRLTGIFGRQAGLKAAAYWWKKIKAVYGQQLSKVELFVDDYGKSSTNQSIDDLPNTDILNILLAQAPLTELLDDWTDDYSEVETKYLGDRDFFRRIVKNPDIINQLFDRPELSHIKAIIWPAEDPDNAVSYIKMITLRSPDVITGRRIYNFFGNSDNVEVRLPLFDTSVASSQPQNSMASDHRS